MGTAVLSGLAPYQVDGVRFLRDNPRSFLADDAGIGKTRQALMAVDGPLTVVTTAAIRDARVWPTEAAKIGWDHPLQVVSYHGLARGGRSYHPSVVFDESHRLKSRKASWFRPARDLVSGADRVHLLSGTPAPNQASELWAPLCLIRQMPAYWPWVRKWFQVTSTPWSAYNVSNRLAACTAACRSECEHWQEFREENLDPLWLRRTRDQILKDLPPLTGQDDPVWTPMTAQQRRVYAGLKKDWVAELDDGSRLEAITGSQRFVQMWRASTALACAVPDADPRESGKARMLTEILEDRTEPVLLVCWFRSTAQMLVDLATSLGLRVVAVGGATTGPTRAEAIRRFQAGQVDVMVGSAGVISEGITLTAAAEVVLVERSWVPAVNEQVIRRLHRIGQTRPVTVRQLVTPNSVDSLQWQTLADKQAGIDPILTASEISRLV